MNYKCKNFGIDIKRLGQLIKQLRLSKVMENGKPMTQLDLAYIAGCTPRTITITEKGETKNPGLITINNIAAALDTTTQYLLEHSKLEG